MLATALIIFREVLEAALIISVVMASTRGVSGRGKYIAGGVALGVLGAVVLAAFAGAIATSVEGVGQELLNAAILFSAVGLLTWHIVWMSRHGKEIVHKIKSIGHDVLAGKKPFYILAILVATTVLREGAEVVLFLHGFAAGGMSALSLLSGSVLGLVTGAALGAALYRGMTLIPLRTLFRVTNVLLMAIAAGMAAKGSSFLVQAGVLDPMGYAVWDTSRVLSDHSTLGNALAALLGYTAKPMGIQVLVYLLTLTGVGTLMHLYNKTLSLRGFNRLASLALMLLLLTMSTLHAG